MQRATFVLEGRVQKVGLRYLVVDEAEERDITGYVKNLKNGTVEIVCEGRKDDIDGFIEAVKGLESAVVENVRAEYSESRDEFVDFHIEREGLDRDEMDGLSDYEKLDRKMDISISEMTYGFSAAARFLKRLTLMHDKSIRKQDETLAEIRGMSAKQDKSLAKQAETLAEIRGMSAKQDESLAKQAETLAEIRGMSAKQDESLAKQAETLAEIRGMSAKQDESLAKQGETLAEIRGMSAKQGETLDEIRGMSAKQAETLAEMRSMSAKQDESLAKQGETVSEIRSMSSNMNAMLDSRFQKLESEIAKIKHKMEI